MMDAGNPLRPTPDIHRIPSSPDFDDHQKTYALDSEEMKGLRHLISTEEAKGTPLTEKEIHRAIQDLGPLGLLRDMAEFFKE
jgi:hypothetical protein